MYVLVRYFAPYDKIFLRRVDCMASNSLPQRFRTSRFFAPSTQKKNKQHLCHKKRTAVSAGGLEASADESDGARYAIRSLNRCTIKILLGVGGSESCLKWGRQPGGTSI